MKKPNKEDYHQDVTGESLMNGPYNYTRYANDLEKYIEELTKQIKEEFECYMATEGCSCCEHRKPHKEARDKLAEILGVAKCENGDYKWDY